MRLLPWPTPDDRQSKLLKRAQDGDRDAFRALYLELYDPVARFVARRVRRREDAEDLVSRVFHGLLEHLGDVDPRRGSVRMFVLTMARNAVIDHARTRRDGLPVEDMAALLADERGGPLDALLQKERLRALGAAMAELPEDVREMLALRHGDGLKHAEIAELLGQREAAVKQRLSRAQRALRERLAGGAARDEEEGAGDEGREGEVIDVRL
ncbi:RNA polymerase sigma factor [Polyangium aurulentum]|uniref:RNA polymerase sigma factor n=1 Tax=Polyangium aurulentum TaxID=2567896 RepID=UPI00146C4A21|nr:sigma-70 family RNA polymerase sigma factor [Polyangium aurulentum]UQA58309.1 sigma-70 family RNA polymerase sigma factor [Polyangium aurulentum]